MTVITKAELRSAKWEIIRFVLLQNGFILISELLAVIYLGDWFWSWFTVLLILHIIYVAIKLVINLATTSRDFDKKLKDEGVTVVD